MSERWKASDEYGYSPWVSASTTDISLDSLDGTHDDNDGERSNGKELEVHLVRC